MSAVVTSPRRSAGEAASQGPGSRSHTPPGAVLLVLALSTFAVVVMQSMVMPIMPGLAQSLNVSMSDVSWVVTVNLLAAAVFTPLLGSLGDSLGRKRVLMLTLVFTTAGSVLVALSPSLPLVLVGRVLQGMGFAAMPLAIGIVRSIFPPERVPSSLAILSALTGIGAGAGLLISGGLVKAGVTAQGMFWISAAATAIGLLGVALLIKLPERATGLHIDIWGLLTLGGGLVCLVLGINRGPSWGWDSATVLSLFAGGLVLLVACFFVEQRVHKPLLDMRMMRKPVVLGTNLTAFLTGVGMYGAFVLVIQFVQTPSRFGYGFGSDALGAGLTLLPLTAGTLVAAGAVSLLIRHIGPKWPMVIGTIVATSTFVFLLIFHTDHWHFYVATGLLGLGLGLAMGAMPTLLNSGVTPEQTSVANSVNQTLRSVGGSIGTAVATAILAANTMPGTPLPTVDAYTTSFAVSGAICVVAIIAALIVPYRHKDALN
ncbi:putative MFS family arabinose efflux permease [Kibdelosporangium banguiense]|uniref:MFS family arabinose efflux permease n=1 Tax=Kibdelosporangium banguiense TaxID=1365924 RepID=A0ABS4U1N5_9PSEU|nr:MFS transporter [Kibdelosporangium banguiense]MBP2330552.1 putative MFS family arabinose efflux permease [Kibdelosporangium banguiense]